MSDASKMEEGSASAPAPVLADAPADAPAPAGADGDLKPVKGSTAMEKVSMGMAGLSVGTSVAAMAFNPLPVVIAAGVFSSAIGPYAYYQQTKLTDIAALKETHAAMQREVSRLSGENRRLHKTVGELSDTVDRLEDVEQALDVITQTQGQSVAAFADQVKANREILGDMQKNLRANVLQNLLQVVIRSDQDDNMQIEEEEIDDLINRIRKINGVEVREDRFRHAITQSGGSLQAVMDIIKNLLADNVSEDEEIFIIKSEK